MNAIEFIFAFFTVFGVSGFWFLWTKFVYDLENAKKEPEEDLVDHAIVTSNYQPAEGWGLIKKWKDESQILQQNHKY